MAAPEAPLCYVGIAKKSAAFRLVKQMLLKRMTMKTVRHLKKIMKQLSNLPDLKEDTREERGGKLVQAYSSKDLEGILVTKAEDSPALNCDQDGTPESVEALESDVLFVEGNVGKDIPPDWWGYKYGFVSGGLLGAQSSKRKPVPTEHDQNCLGRTPFHEDDQENLYNLVQNKATTGKQGLGIKDRPSKIAGCHFQGKKTSFDDSDGEDSADCSYSKKRKYGDASESETKRVMNQK